MNLKFIVFSLFLLQLITFTSQQIQPYTKLTSSQIKSLEKNKEYTVQTTNTSKYTRHNFFLDYQYFINAYSLDLFRVDSDGTRTQIPTVAEDKEIDYGSLDGCVAQNRDIDYQLNFSLNVENKVGVEGSDAGSTDYLALVEMTIDTDNKKIFVFHHNFQVQQITYQTQDISGEIKSLKLDETKLDFSSNLNFGSTPIEFANSAIKVINHGGFVYIFTHYGALYFEIKEDLAADSFKSLSGFVLRESIHQVKVQSNTIFVASGINGLDIYRINGDSSNKSLTSLQTLNINFFKPQGGGQVDIDVNDVKYDVSRNMLYVLEANSGLHMIAFTNLEQAIPQSNLDNHFYVPILYGKYFDYHLNTVIVVQEIQDINFGFEFFLDFEGKTYYINNQFYQDLKFHGVIVEDDYALLLSDYSHRVVYHSIYKEYTNKYSELHDYFYDPLIKQMQIIKTENNTKDKSNFIGLDHHETHYVIGLKFNGINIHRIKLKTPSVRCQGRTHGLKKYELQLTSALCPTEYYNENFTDKNERSSIKLFSKCLSTHQFNITFKKKDDDNGNKTAGTVIAIVIVIFALFVIGFGVWYKFIHQKRIKQQKKEINDFEEKKNKALQNREELEQKISQKEKKLAQMSEEKARKEQRLALQDNNNEDELQSHGQQYQIDDDDDIEIDSYIPPTNQQQKQANNGDSNNINTASPNHGRQPTQKGLVNTNEDEINFDHAPETEAQFRQQKRDDEKKENGDDNDDENDNELVDF